MRSRSASARRYSATASARAGGQVGGREFVAGADRVGVVLAEDPLGIGQHAVKDPGRAVSLAGGDKGVAQAQPRADHVGVILAELHGLAGVDQPLEPGDGVLVAAGRQAGLGQPPSGQQRVRMPGAEQLAAGRDQVAPVIHRGTGQARVVQAVPGP